MRTCIIAEAGVNHNGKIDLAKELVDIAKWAGADIVKFQTFVPDALACESAMMAGYQKKNIGTEKSQKQMLEELALSYDDFRELKDYCHKKKIEFLSTPFDLPSIDFLKSIGCCKWKIPSGEINNYPYLVKVGKLKEPVILSTGMSNLKEVDEAVSILEKEGTTDITLLQCTSQYPTEYQNVNLNAMITMRDVLKKKVGCSDHTLGTEVAIAAVALGASIVEKHFTIDKNMAGPDHKASLTPQELRSMVAAIRNVEEALGDGNKVPSETELETRVLVRKSIVASQDISKGEVLTSSNITTKRPGNGICPMEWDKLLGTIAVHDYKKDEIISV